MPRSRIIRACKIPKSGSVQLRAFSSSCAAREGRESFLKSKLSTVDRDLAGEKWVLDLGPSPLSRFLCNEVGEEPVELNDEENGPIWKLMYTMGPHQQAAVKDETRLFRENGSVTVDPIYLRDCCKCSLCVDPYTRQRKFLTAHIPWDIEAVFEGRSTHGRVRVGWRNDIPGFPDSHQSCYSQTELRSLTSPPPESAVARKRHYWDGATFKKRSKLTRYDDFVKDTEAYKAAMSALHRDGLIFITDVDASEQAVGTMAERIGPLRNTFYGSTWDVRPQADSKNVAYTNQHLGFHMDLLYMANPPGYQLLHCLKNSCSGGESRFADAFFAATRLWRSDRQAYRLLCKYPVEWTYENDGQFYLQRRPTFHEVSHFIPSGENTRRRVQRKENGDDDADLAYVNWSPPFQGRLYQSHIYPERTSAFVAATKDFDRILNSDDMVIEMTMEEGTCAIFENRRVVHARNAFTMDGGDRWLRGAYVDEDAFWSRCRALGADVYDTSTIPQPEGHWVRRYDIPQ